MSDTTLTRNATPRSIARDIADAWLHEIRCNRVFYAILAAWLACTIAISILRQDGFLAEFGEYMGRAIRAGLIIACFAVASVGVKVLVRRPDRPLKAFGTALVAFFPGPMVLRCAYGFLVFAVFMASFLYSKMLIPQMSPFAWDETFTAWDQALFGGYQPWMVLQPLLGYPLVTRALDYAYVGWVPGIFLFWSWMIASPNVPLALRRQYWIATILSWILLGVVAATLLSSVGPCFLPQFFPGLAGEYTHLNGYLAALHQDFGLASSLTKEHLLEVYAGLTTEPGGISAMPGMHNAQAMLFVLAAYRVNRALGHVMVGYAIVIFLASVMLAWHYAVDSIAGMAGAAAIWWLASYLSQDRPEKVR